MADWYAERTSGFMIFQTVARVGAWSADLLIAY